MVAFCPIAPAAARELLLGVGEADVGAILTDFVEAGLIKAYARVIEKLSVGGGRTELRDARIPRDLWRRILAEDMAADVWTKGSVRLHGDGMVGGKPAVIITGIRFSEQTVRDAAYKHSAQIAVVPAPVRAPKSKAPAAPAVKPSTTITNVADAPPLIPIATVPAASTAKRGLGSDELCVSVQEAMEILGVGRTTIYKLRDDSKLIMTKIGGRTMVDAASIRKLLSVDA